MKAIATIKNQLLQVSYGPQQCCNRDFLLRKCMFLLAIFSFTAMATGAILVIHLASCEHSEQHSAEECPICQLLLAAPNKYVAQGGLLPSHHYQLEYNLELSYPLYVQHIYLQSFSPRAPPRIS